jgi:hypothetical protein
MSVDRQTLIAVIDQLTRQYEAADEARRKAEREMLKAATAIKAIFALTTDEPLQFTGSLADACRRVVHESNKPLTPVDVRNAIVALGYNVTRHKNPLASIHSVLKRLETSGELKQATVSATSSDGSVTEKPAYRWVGNSKAAERRSKNVAHSTIGVDMAALVDRLRLPDDLQRAFANFPTISPGLQALIKSLEQNPFSQLVKQMEEQNRRLLEAGGSSKLADLSPAKTRKE